MTQTTLSLVCGGPNDPAELRRALHGRGWQTREQLCSALMWSERRVRSAAEALGSEVVKCQRGFCLTDELPRADLGSAQQAIDAAFSQARKMCRYANALRKRIHARVA